MIARESFYQSKTEIFSRKINYHEIYTVVYAQRKHSFKEKIRHYFHYEELDTS